MQGVVIGWRKTVRQCYSTGYAQGHACTIWVIKTASLGRKGCPERGGTHPGVAPAVQTSRPQEWFYVGNWGRKRAMQYMIAIRSRGSIRSIAIEGVFFLSNSYQNLTSSTSDNRAFEWRKKGRVIFRPWHCHATYEVATCLLFNRSWLSVHKFIATEYKAS